MFSKFAAFYGHVWRSQFKDEVFMIFAKKEWLDALGEFSEMVLTKAILNCRDFYELPPTLPQMLHCCRQIKKQTVFHVVNESHVPANKAVVEACLQQCKKLLSS
ncbi:MAG: Vir protein [Legionella sp.]|nr:Vir protein [Legionella sp.]